MSIGAVNDDAVILSALTRILREEIDRPEFELEPTDSMETIGDWDSLAHVRIVASIETEYGFQFEISEIEDATSVEKLIAAIQRHTA